MLVRSEELAAPRDDVAEGHMTALWLWCSMVALLLVGGGTGHLLLTSHPLPIPALVGASEIEQGAQFCLVAGGVLFVLGMGLRRLSHVGRLGVALLAALGVALGQWSTMSLYQSLLGQHAPHPSPALPLLHLVGHSALALFVPCHLALALFLLSPRAIRLCSPGYRQAMNRAPARRSAMLGSPFLWAPPVLAFLSLTVPFLLLQALQGMGPTARAHLPVGLQVIGLAVFACLAYAAPRVRRG